MELSDYNTLSMSVISFVEFRYRVLSSCGKWCCFLALWSSDQCPKALEVKSHNEITYFPTQNELKIAPRTSSVLTSIPDTDPMARAAYLSDSAAMSI